MIGRQQALIKKLLKKRDSSNSLFDENEVKKSIADTEALNDSDSAIIIDEHKSEDLGIGEAHDGQNEVSKVITVGRSVSDVVVKTPTITQGADIGCLFQQSGNFMYDMYSCGQKGLYTCSFME